MGGKIGVREAEKSCKKNGIVLSSLIKEEEKVLRHVLELDFPYL